MYFNLGNNFLMKQIDGRKLRCILVLYAPLQIIRIAYHGFGSFDVKQIENFFFLLVNEKTKQEGTRASIPTKSRTKI